MIEELEDKLVIAWLQEEEYVSSFLDLLLKIFQVLKQDYSEEYETELDSQVENLYQLSADDALRQAERILKEFIGDQRSCHAKRDRTLLLIMENLDEIFKGLGDIGQKQFRAYIQNNNFITILATSQSLFDGVKSREYPFYGFFNPHYLEKLTKEEAQSLLLKIAQLENNQELETFIQSTKGRDRIAAIHHLAGGNHRVYIIFSQFLTRDSLDELVQPVMQTLDELTPYYQAKMQWLSPQQRKIIEFLCDRRNAIPVKEIAQRCFITHQTASSQLKDLREKGYVTSESIGRASYYELQEPLMRICLEVKKQRGEPIKLFIDFLRIWYTEKELKERLEILPEKCLEREYINYALAARAELILSDSTQKVSEEDKLIDRGITEVNTGNLETALKLFDQAIKINSENDYIWTNRGIALYKLGRFEEALDSFNKAIKINQDDDFIWLKHGLALRIIGRFEEALASYNKAITINQNNDSAWSSRGVTLCVLGRFKEALNSFDKAIKINPNDDFVWVSRGVDLGELGRLEEAIVSHRKAISINPDNDSAWAGQGFALGGLGRFKEALDCFDKAIKINSDDYFVWVSRGFALRELGRFEEALASYNKAISVNYKYPFVFLNLIGILFKLNRWEEGFKDLDDALNRFANTEEFETGETTEFIQIIWESTTDITIWKSRLKTLVEIYDKHQVVSTLSKGIVDNVPILMSEMVSNKAASSWLEIWQEIAGDKPELAIALRFLKTAVEYKETKGDRKVLLQLAKEERELLESLLKLSSEFRVRYSELEVF